MARAKITARWSSKVFGARSSVEQHGDAEGGYYYDGAVFTPDGIVLVYSQGWHTGGRLKPASTFRVVVRGREYAEVHDHAYTPRALAVIARRFARKIAAGGR